MPQTQPPVRFHKVVLFHKGEQNFSGTHNSPMGPMSTLPLHPPPTPLAVLGQTHLKNTLAAGVYVFPRAVGHPSPRLADPLPVRQKQAAAYNTIIPNKSTFAVHCNF